jgi:hypothetical protein
MFRHRIDRLSEYSTQIAIVEGLLAASVTWLRPQSIDADQAAKCVLEAVETLNKLQGQLYDEMDFLQGVKKGESDNG